MVQDNRGWAGTGGLEAASVRGFSYQELCSTLDRRPCANAGALLLLSYSHFHDWLACDGPYVESRGESSPLVESMVGSLRREAGCCVTNRSGKYVSQSVLNGQVEPAAFSASFRRKPVGPISERHWPVRL